MRPAMMEEALLTSWLLAPAPEAAPPANSFMRAFRPMAAISRCASLALLAVLLPPEAGPAPATLSQSCRTISSARASATFRAR
jgi:hypothetical protein